MFKRVGLLVSLLLAVPAFASAWTISARVASGSGNVQAVANTNLLPAPGYASVANTLTSQDLIVVPAANNVISRVLVDGVVATPVSAGVYKVNYNSKSSHTLTAYFTADAAAKFTVDSLQDLKAVTGTNGTFTIQQVNPTLSAPTTGDLTNVVAGSKIKVVAIPKEGYTVSSILVNGSAATAVVRGTTLIADNITVTGDTTVSAVYAQAPVITFAEPAKTSSMFTPSTLLDTAPVTVTIAATGNAATGALSYSTVILDAAGNPAKDARDPGAEEIGTLTTNPAVILKEYINSRGKQDFSFLAPGNYTARVTVTGANGGTATKDFAFTVGNNLEVANACTGCHSNSSKTLVANWTATKHAESSGHDSAKCFRCHNAKGYLYAEKTNYTGDQAVINATATYPTFTGSTDAPTPISCATCHTDNGHLGALRPVLGWDPNGNAKVDQFDVCTSCHTLQNTTAKLDHFHSPAGTSVRDGIIADTHYDNPATNEVEGYVVRITNDKACAECHNVHQAETQSAVAGEVTIQQQWARSGHAGKVLAAKEALKKADGITALDMKNAADLTTRSNGAATDASAPAWVHYSWEATDRQACQHCHTATGAANYLSNRATYNAANNDFSHLKVSGTTSQNEVLYCWGCHSDAGTGELRNTGSLLLDYKAAAADATNIVLAKVGNGNSTACYSCHMGRGNVQSLMATATQAFVTADPAKVLTATSTPKYTASATSTHYFNAGATILKNESKVGYEFPGLTYANPSYFKHNTVGCAECHMSGEESHSFEVVKKDAAGVIVALEGTNCITCHTGAHGAALTTTDIVVGDGKAAAAAAFLEEEAEGYKQALAAFNAALIAKKIIWTPNHPYFMLDVDADGAITAADKQAKFTDPTTKVVTYVALPIATVGELTIAAGWTDVDKDGAITDADIANVGPLWADEGTLGAAHNYNYLFHEPGAYAHNMMYAKRLIFDSIDWLDGGVMNGSINVNADTYPEAAVWFGATVGTTGTYAATRK